MFVWRFVANYFNISRKQAWGALALSIIALILMGVNYYLPYIILPQEQSLTITQKSLLAQLKPIDSSYLQNNKSYTSSKSDGSNIKGFTFNPNSLNEIGWAKLGFSDKQIKTIFNYKSKGGKFYSKADVQKMYCISAQEFDKLEKFIQLPNKQVNGFNKFEPKPLLKININTADTAQWNKLRGIGPVLANRIVTYKNSLGGFYNPSQLLEVYGITDTLLKNIKPQLIVDAKQISKIKINEILYQDLLQHPYFKQCALNILKTRKKSGSLTSIEDFALIEGISKESLTKMKPYLAF